MVATRRAARGQHWRLYDPQAAHTPPARPVCHPCRHRGHCNHGGHCNHRNHAGGVPWGGISGLPAGFQDNVDNDTKYTAGTGLSLTGTVFSLNSTYSDDRYVNVAGDVMTGALVTPNLTVSETLTADQIISPEGIMSVESQGDMELQIDKDNSAALPAFFEIFNGAGKHVFYVNELGNSRTFGNHSVDGTVTADGFSGDGAGLTTAGLVKTTVLDVNCGTGVDFTTTFKKLADIGTFTKVRGNSTIEVTFNGRLYVESMAAAATGARFELRVDGAAPPTDALGRLSGTRRLADMAFRRV